MFGYRPALAPQVLHHSKGCPIMTHAHNVPVTDLYPGPDGVYQATQTLVRPSRTATVPQPAPARAATSLRPAAVQPRTVRPQRRWTFGHTLIAFVVVFGLLALTMTVATLAVNWRLGVPMALVVAGVPLTVWLRRSR